MTTSLKSMKGEASETTLWDSIPPPCVSTGPQQQAIYSPSVVPQGASSSTAVEALSSQMVSDIIHEVTRKGSSETVVEPEGGFEPVKIEQIINEVDMS
jgi:hypothetical protein